MARSAITLFVVFCRAVADSSFTGEGCVSGYWESRRMCTSGGTFTCGGACLEKAHAVLETCVGNETAYDPKAEETINIVEQVRMVQDWCSHPCYSQIFLLHSCTLDAESQSLNASCCDAYSSLAQLCANTTSPEPDEDGQFLNLGLMYERAAGTFCGTSPGDIWTPAHGQCEFDSNLPSGVGHFWDPTCEITGGIGCNADGKHLPCRFCGGGDYLAVPCPPSSCKFASEPYVPYYWDAECEIGMLGCWADGVHAQCRFCGDFPFTGIPCPEGAAPPAAASCAFGVEPETPYYWDPACSMGMHGCNADGKNVHCRFCGGGGFEDVHCPGSHVCEFEVLPTVPYFWDAECQDGMLGCKADGVHPECRFCGQRPFEAVPCPEPTAPPQNQCHWPQRGEPAVPYFWDESCEMGLLGCWADGIHGQCRYCGVGVYSEVACPEGIGNSTANTSLRGSTRR